MYMWQMSVFSHESAQRNDAGHLIYENVFKMTCCFEDIPIVSVLGKKREFNFSGNVGLDEL